MTMEIKNTKKRWEKLIEAIIAKFLHLLRMVPVLF